jgi:putative membrane protein
MKSPFLRILSLSATSALLTTSALAQAPATPAPGTPATGAPPTAATVPPKPLSVTDKNFVKNAAGSMQYLIQIAEAAKASSAFADPQSSLVRLRDSTTKDIKKALEALNKLAQARGETLPTEITGSDKMSVERLGKLKDDKFPKQWVEDLAKEAKHLDKDFESASKTIQDPDLKTYVANYGPMVHVTFTGAEAAEKSQQKKK